MSKYKEKQAAIIKSKNKICEGNCKKHIGEINVVRVVCKKTGYDWGYFSYCESAIKEDTEKRNMKIEVLVPV